MKITTDDVYDFIKSYIEENKISPTFDEIRRGLGFKSSSTVSYWLDKLVKEGRLTYRVKSARSIVLL